LTKASKAYIAAQAIWGFPQTVLGAAVLLRYAGRPHFRFHGAVVTTWESRKALSLGPFIFIGGSSDHLETRASVDERLLVHEYGHTVQSLALGPLYLLVVGLPSVIWLNLPFLSRMRKRRGLSYYAFYTERSANALGERVTGKPSVGLAHID